ncbi:hypothetical protein [Streptomyces afghaniensis 772] [Streptomyces afghaniensis]
MRIDDGRAFLERTKTKYDLIVLALPDSLTLVAGASNLRLESYLFTRQAFEGARDIWRRTARSPCTTTTARAGWSTASQGGLDDVYGRALHDDVQAEAPPCGWRGMAPTDQSCAKSWQPSGEVPAATTTTTPSPTCCTGASPRSTWAPWARSCW